MYRIEATLLLLSLLPLIMAAIFSLAVIPRRKRNLATSMAPESRPAVHHAEEGFIESLVERGIKRALEDYESLGSSRLIVPAALLSFLYWLSFSLGVSVLLKGDRSYLMCRAFLAFDTSWLFNPVVAAVGAYVFNTGLLVRRAFMADFTKNIMWASINRLVLSCGFAIVLHFMLFGAAPEWKRTGIVLSFAVAFFPRFFITVLRRKVTENFGISDDSCKELSIQLIQGIDIWKQERLEEEGIESVQNMASADIFGLIPKLHYPVRTIIDWMSQAIFIQRFCLCFSGEAGALERLRALEMAGFPTRAIDYVYVAGTEDLKSSPFVAKMAEVAKVDTAVLQEAIRGMSQDAALRVLQRLWQIGSIND